MASSVCATQIETITYVFIIPVFFASTFIISTAVSYWYVSAYCKNHLEISKLQYYIAVLFFLTMIIWGIAGICHFELMCHHPLLSDLFNIVTFSCYLCQGILLLVTFLLRLKSIFEDSVFEISTCTICTYISLLSVTGILSVVNVTLILTQKAETIRSGLIGLAFLLYVSIFVWINYLFIAKLLKLISQSGSKIDSYHEGLMYVATKNAVLCLVSSATIVCTTCGLFVFAAVPTIYNRMGFNLLLQFDVITNTLSMLLAYKYFDAWYMRICGICHRKCGSFCIGCVKTKHPDVVVEEMPCHSPSEEQVPSRSHDPSTNEEKSPQIEL